MSRLELLLLMLLELFAEKVGLVAHRERCVRGARNLPLRVVHLHLLQAT